MQNLRFKDFNEDELYILKRALIEATIHIWTKEEHGGYTEDELDLFDKLLAEVIENIKALQQIEENVASKTDRLMESK